MRDKMNDNIKLVAEVFSKASGITGGLVINQSIWSKCFKLDKDVDKFNRFVSCTVYKANPSNRN